jgi:hypothetical protein
MTDDKMFILNDNAKNDPAVQMAIQAYKKTLMREEQYRKDVLSGKIQPIPTTTWSISDRD